MNISKIINSRQGGVTNMEALPGADIAEIVTNMRAEFEVFLESIGSQSCEQNIEKLTSIGAMYCPALEDKFRELNVAMGN